MYYRRKIILSILQAFDNQLEKLVLQKLLFLLTDMQKDNAAYHFVPYKFGCFSFQANADLITLKKYGIVDEIENRWIKQDEVDYLTTLKDYDKQAIKLVKLRYGKMRWDELIKLTYKKYPFYAINSTIVENQLSNQELKELKKLRSGNTTTVLFTIGYEGISLEEYLNKLLKNNVKVLCDVRRNAQSMKYGFSKKQLHNACDGIGIQYFHFPEVGIPSDKRQNLETQADYDALFEQYKKNTLSKTQDVQRSILHLLKEQRRIALTCFESNIEQCHRKHLAGSITQLPDFKYKLVHI